MPLVKTFLKKSSDKKFWFANGPNDSYKNQEYYHNSAKMEGNVFENVLCTFKKLRSNANVSGYVFAVPQ